MQLGLKTTLTASFWREKINFPPAGWLKLSAHWPRVWCCFVCEHVFLASVLRPSQQPPFSETLSLPLCCFVELCPSFFKSGSYEGGQRQNGVPIIRIKCWLYSCSLWGERVLLKQRYRVRIKKWSGYTQFIFMSIYYIVQVAMVNWCSPGSQ